MLSARARNKRDVGTATVLGVVLALLLYVLISVLALGILSRPELAALPNPSMAGLMAQMTGSWGKVLISVGLIVSVLASYVSWTLFSAEVPFSAARHGAFPAIFRRQNRNGTPIASLWLTSLTVQGCLLLVWLLGKGYTNLLLISTSMILVPYLLIGLFLLKLSFNGKSESGQGNGLVRAVALVSVVMVSGCSMPPGWSICCCRFCSTGRVCCCFSTAAASSGRISGSAGASGCWPG